MLSPDQNKLDENLTKAGQKNLQDHYVFFYGDAYFNKKKQKNKKHKVPIRKVYQ